MFKDFASVEMQNYICKMYIICGVAEHRANHIFFYKKNSGIPSDNADMSNDKGINPSPKAYGI